MENLKSKSFVVVGGEQDGRNVSWVGRVLLPVHLTTTGNGDIEEFSYVQYIEVMKAISGVHRGPGCVCL